jgi:uncharacterized protein YbjT (DUF2867 family)
MQHQRESEGRNNRAMADRKNILVVGATGKQGGAVVKALLAMPPTTPPMHILAVTRNPESGSAKRLITDDHANRVTLVTGDLTNSTAIFATQPKGSIAAAFLVTMLGKGEEEQGKAFINAAVAHEVKHIVFSSLDRGGDERSWINPTTIPHFVSKHNIELHIRQLANERNNGFTWAIIRPVAFMDNLNPGSMGSMFAAAWNLRIPPTKRLQLVGSRDIGLFAAWALIEPDKWRGRAFGLATDNLTLPEVKRIFKENKNRDLPQGYAIVAWLVMLISAEFGRMLAWFRDESFAVDMDAVQKEARLHRAQTHDFATWLREESTWERLA